MITEHHHVIFFSIQNIEGADIRMYPCSHNKHVWCSADPLSLVGDGAISARSKNRSQSQSVIRGFTPQDLFSSQLLHLPFIHFIMFAIVGRPICT